MIIAQQKKKENIVEYVLYMMQIQDIIRALNFDIEKIQEKLINQYKVSDTEKEEIENWYSDIIICMKQENLSKTGYIKSINEIIKNLDSFHAELLKDKKNAKYSDAYQWAKPNIDVFRLKSKTESDNDILLCINALYGLLLLKLKNTEITEETKSAMQTISNLMGLLAANYKQKNQ